jgi:hypothetical protein
VTQPGADTTATIQAIKDNAQRLGLTWQIQYATVADGSAAGAVIVTFDSDALAVATPTVSLIGVLAETERVAVLTTPPDGAYVIGLLTDFRGVIDFVSSAANTATATAGVEAVCLTGNVITWLNGRAYRIEFHQLETPAAGAGFVEFRVRRTNIAGTVLLDDVFMPPLAGVRTTCQASGYVVNNSGAAIVDNIVFDHVGSVNVTGFGTTTSLRWMSVTEAGPSSKYPLAIQI